MGWCCSRCRCHYRRILVMFVWQRIKPPNATNEFVLFFSFGVFQEEQRASSAMNIIICRHFSVMDCAKRWSFPKVILDALCRRRRHRRRCQKFAICTTSAIPVVRTHNHFDSIFMCVRCGFCQTHNLVIICNNKNNTRRQNVRLAFNISDASRLELDLLYCFFFFRHFAPSYAITLFSRAQHMVFSAIQCAALRHAEREGGPKHTTLVSLRILYLNILLYFVVSEKASEKMEQLERLHGQSMCAWTNRPTNEKTVM